MLTLILNEKQIQSKVTSDRFGRFVSHEWKRLINLFTPRDTGELERNVDELPFALHYRRPYASKVYNGYWMNFQKINPYATYEWDQKAEQAGQKAKLYRTLNAALRRGLF